MKTAHKSTSTPLTLSIEESGILALTTGMLRFDNFNTKMFLKFASNSKLALANHNNTDNNNTNIKDNIVIILLTTTRIVKIIIIMIA